MSKQWELCIDSARKQLEPLDWQGTWDEPRNIENGKPLIFRWMPCRKMRSRDFRHAFFNKGVFPDFFPLFSVSEAEACWVCTERNFLLILVLAARMMYKNDDMNYVNAKIEETDFQKTIQRSSQVFILKVEGFVCWYLFVGLESNASSSMSVVCIVSASMFSCVFASSPFRSSHLPVSAGALRPCIAETCRADEVLRSTKFTNATTRRREERPTRPSHPSFKKSEAEASSAPKINLARLIFHCERIHNERICKERKLERLWHNAITIEVVRRFTNENGAIFSFTFPLTALCRVFWLPMRCQNPKFVWRVCFTSSLQKVYHGCRGCCPRRSSIAEWERSRKCQHPNDSNVRRFWTISAEIAASNAVTTTYMKWHETKIKWVCHSTFFVWRLCKDYVRHAALP